MRGCTWRPREAAGLEPLNSLVVVLDWLKRSTYVLLNQSRSPGVARASRVKAARVRETVVEGRLYGHVHFAVLTDPLEGLVAC